MVLCNQYVDFSQAADGSYSATAASLYPSVSLYKIRIIGVSNTFFLEFTLALNEVKSFNLPSDGVYSFNVLNNANSNPIFVDNVLELRKIITCYTTLLGKIANPTPEVIASVTCDPCKPVIETCSNCKKVKEVNQAQVIGLLNAMFPYLTKVMYAIAPERLALVGLHPLDESTYARQNLMKEAFSDITVFLNSCGTDIFAICDSTVSGSGKTCNCQ